MQSRSTLELCGARMGVFRIVALPVVTLLETPGLFLSLREDGENFSPYLILFSSVSWFFFHLTKRKRIA